METVLDSQGNLAGHDKIFVERKTEFFKRFPVSLESFRDTWMAGVSSDKSNARVAALRQMLDGEPDSLAIVDHDRGNTPAWNAEIHEDERNIQPFDVVHKLRIHLPGNDHTIDIPFEQKARDGEFFF